jgi:hypothetical protein
MMLLVDFFTWAEIELIYSPVFRRNETQACCSGFWGVKTALPFLLWSSISQGNRVSSLFILSWINAVVVSRLQLNYHNRSVSIFFSWYSSFSFCV